MEKMSNKKGTSPTVPPGQDPDGAATDVAATPQSLVTQELVEIALRNDKSPNAQLVSWECRDFTRPGDNYACVVSSVEVDYKEGGEEHHVTYVVKLNPCRHMFNEYVHDVFHKEGLFYRDVVPELNKCLREAGMATLSVPKFIHAHLERNKEVIILEDLRPRGFKMFDRKKGQDFAHAELILKELGRLHAASVLLQRQNPNTSLLERFPFLEDLFLKTGAQEDETLKTMFANNFAGAKSIAESTPGYEHAFGWIENFSPKAFEIMCKEVLPSSAALTVINHGDCWTNNLLFRYNADGNPIEAILLDLQVSRTCDPGCDLSYFLYSSFNGEDRNANLEDFLDIYYDSFKQVLDAGKTQVPYTRHELADNFGDHYMFGIMMGMVFAAIVLADSEDVMDFTKIKEENMEESMQEWGERTTKVINKSPLAQSRLLCLFDELVKRGEIPSKE
ncbi:uncharacterized protein LOC143040002 [Oratosquilla oratoria]|uniref:uncharacterized protein LOC143040002 n=1 Tax=Oratosquilla oratoria TaxID=337810 RepID=UPI003F75748D